MNNYGLTILTNKVNLDEELVNFLTEQVDAGRFNDNNVFPVDIINKDRFYPTESMVLGLDEIDSLTDIFKYDPNMEMIMNYESTHDDILTVYGSPYAVTVTGDSPTSLVPIYLLSSDNAEEVGHETLLGAGFMYTLDNDNAYVMVSAHSEGENNDSANNIDLGDFMNPPEIDKDELSRTEGTVNEDTLSPFALFCINEVQYNLHELMNTDNPKSGSSLVDPDVIISIAKTLQEKSEEWVSEEKIQDIIKEALSELFKKELDSYIDYGRLLNEKYLKDDEE